MASHDPVGRDPVFAGGEDPDCRQHFLVGCVNVFVDNCCVKEVAVEIFDMTGLIGTAFIILILYRCTIWVCDSVKAE